MLPVHLPASAIGKGNDIGYRDMMPMVRRMMAAVQTL